MESYALRYFMQNHCALLEHVKKGNCTLKNLSARFMGSDRPFLNSKALVTLQHCRTVLKMKELPFTFLQMPRSYSLLEHLLFLPNKGTLWEERAQSTVIGSSRYY